MPVNRPEIPNEREAQIPSMTLSRQEQKAVALFFVACALVIGTLFFVPSCRAYFAARSRGVGAADGLEVVHEPRPQADVCSYRVNVNTASMAELMLLPGVGEVTARKILREREQNGPFRSIDDLARVNGIGVKKIRNMREFLSPITDTEVLVDGASTLQRGGS